jgi:hypothetical protein
VRVANGHSNVVCVALAYRTPTTGSFSEKGSW